MTPFDGDAIAVDLTSLDTDDRQLVAAISIGDRVAFEMLNQLHGRSLLRFLSRVLDDAELAEEIVQDTFLGIWRKPRFDGRSSVRTWIFAIATRKVRDRSRRARISVVREFPELPSADRGPEAIAIATASVRDLTIEIARLPRAQKEVLYLAFVEELSHSEVAKVLDIPLGTVKSRLDGARRELRRRTVEQGDCNANER